MTITSPAQTSETLASKQPTSVRDALEYASAYEQVAAFLAANPDLAEQATVHLARYTHIVPPADADPVAFIVDAAKKGREFGATIEEWADGKHGGVKIHLGPLYVSVYTTADRVCRKVVVGVIEDVKYALVVDLDGNPRKDADQAEAVAQ
ncbi:hypothetical protein ACIBQ1_09465 [Nonomuraea sp. NPDC050153]|uniref:hypothetical protein n=1 Tax=Nonomuraea sp. NPDC050153 TaxID=3364359 RepID=UPI0037B2567F